MIYRSGVCRLKCVLRSDNTHVTHKNTHKAGCWEVDDVYCRRPRPLALSPAFVCCLPDTAFSAIVPLYFETKVIM